MSQYYSEPPTDAYSTDEIPSAYGWDAPTERPAAPLLPYTPPGLPTAAEREAKRERAAAIWRLVIALVMAIPLTAIAATAGGGNLFGGILNFFGIALTWAGIALVVSLSQGKGLPRRG